MFSLLRALLLPFALGKTVKVDIKKNTPGTQWSSGWLSIIGSQYFGGTLMSVRDPGATLTYEFTGTRISVYGAGEITSNNRANSSFILDGSMPHLHQEPMAIGTSNVLYASPLLEDTQHELVIRNLVAGGDLQLDYFEVTGSTVQVERLTPTPHLSSRSIHPRGEGLQPAVIAGLALAAVAVLLGFVILFILWRREYLRERKEKLDHPKVQLRSQDDVQTVPFLDERAHIEPFTTAPVLSQPPQTPRITTPTVMTVTPTHPRPSREQVVTTTSAPSRRDEKRPHPTAPVYTIESISRLNLALDVNPRDHSVVGQPSNYESEAGANPRNRENDGGVSLLGSSETINPKVLRLPPDYRRFYP